MVEKITIWYYLEPFLESREYMHLADLSKKLKKPHPTVRQQLNYFENLGVLLKTNKGRMTLYKLNTSHHSIIDYLVIAEKVKVLRKRSKSLLLNETMSFLQKIMAEDNKAVIFGSSVEDIKKANDVDLLITGDINLNDEIKAFEKKFNISIHLIKIKNLNSVNESLKTEIIKKHLIIQGSEEVIKWLI